MSTRILELCACEGGGTAGFQRAGFEVYAVDLDRNRLKRNPAEGYVVADALVVLEHLLTGAAVPFKKRDGTFIQLRLEDFDAIHVSPPCQYYTRGNASLRVPGEVLPATIGGWPRLIPTFRQLLELTGKPYVIENVEDAAWDMRDPTTLCGCMFRLSTIDTDGVKINLKRQRLFETNFPFEPPRACNHAGITQWAGAYGGARRDKVEARTIRKGGYVPPDKDVVKALLGVQHDMTWKGLFECLPPAYMTHVGAAILQHLNQKENQ